MRFQNFEATIIGDEDVDEIFKIILSNFVHIVIWCCVTFILGLGPCNFRSFLDSHFLESVYDGKSLVRVGFGHPLHGWPKP